MLLCFVDSKTEQMEKKSLVSSMGRLTSSCVKSTNSLCSSRTSLLTLISDKKSGLYTPVTF